MLGFRARRRCQMSATRRMFPETFKREAVDRVTSSGLSVEKVATELGLHETVLRRWVKQFSGHCQLNPCWQKTGPARDARSRGRDRIPPSVRRLSAEDPQRRARDEMTLEVEGVVDGGVHAK